MVNVDAARDGGHRGLARRRGDSLSGQATIEFVLAVGILMLFLIGVTTIGRLNNGRIAVLAAAREAARPAALGTTPDEAIEGGIARGEATGHGHGLTNGTLVITVDTTAFAPSGYVRTTASYRVTLADLPLLRSTDLPLRSTAQELIPAHKTVIVDRR